MCTAITYRTKDHYFGRNLDLECSFGEEVVVTPRNFPFQFLSMPEQKCHYAMIGVAHVAEDYPLYYEATNEKGLSVAGLNFPVSAVYASAKEGDLFVAPFELTPWLLGQCETAKQAEALLNGVLIANIPFRNYPLTPLHWMVSDKDYSFVAEPRVDGLHSYPNPVGVLTNEPPFDVQMLWLSYYMGLSPNPAENRFAPGVELGAHSRGMGAIGLPGDLSSQSRFVRAAFAKLNSVCGEGERESVSQFFHLLGSVEQTRGCVRLESGAYEITRYSSCCNTGKGIYYYRTYEDSRVKAVEMHREDLDGDRLIRYPLVEEKDFLMQNR